MCAKGGNSHAPHEESLMRTAMLATFLLAFVLAGCTTELERPRIEARVAPVTVHIGSAPFCPPGQVRKGRC